MQSVRRLAKAPSNPYLCTGVKDNDSNPNTWSGLPEDLQDKILRKAGLRFVCEFDNERKVPLELRPPLLPENRGEPWASTTQRIVITRSRHAIESHGPRDVLTVSFSDCVDKDWYGFDTDRDRYNYMGYDTNAVCQAMDIKRTWTDVIKIRLVFNDEHFEYSNSYDLVLTRRGVNGREENVHVPPFGALHSRADKEEFAQRLVEGLHLRRRVVAGCDEFTVA